MIKQTKIVPLILVAEDDDFLRRVYEVKLPQSGFKVIGAKDGEEAIKLLKDNKPEIILLDIVMPKKTGFEVLEFINQDVNLKKIPVIFLSNLGQEEDVKKGKKLGAVDFLIKANTPINKVVEKVKKYL